MPDLRQGSYRGKYSMGRAAMMPDEIWEWVFVVGFGLVCFLVGRWRGIRDFDKAMVDAGHLPPHGSGLDE